MLISRGKSALCLVYFQVIVGCFKPKFVSRQLSDQIEEFHLKINGDIISLCISTEKGPLDKGKRYIRDLEIYTKQILQLNRCINFRV